MNIIKKYTAPVLFCILGITFAIVLAVLLIQDKKARALEKRVSDLQRNAISSMRFRRAADDFQKMMLKAVSVIPAGYEKMNPETEVFRTLDTIKSRFKYAEMKVSAFDFSNNMVVMPLSIKVYITDYADFVNNVSMLQSLVFPFFTLSDIKMLKSVDDGSVTADINGRLWFPEKNRMPEGSMK
ncbi:MAG: hypothetical protein RBT37_01005 [Dissulfurispiraceae bacterium]|jgi:hypothetical protein|nr:hypothetical protein [Dissulfurispiraceae bacterium]